ncbi:phosphate ABC transporter substrate-binding protein [Nitrosomonas communis]|uniref:phosphate ABC transporter substrate-binding protein n=1 Tax=Nitrosomonas communis TaxID=44574 RepID=UPI003D275A68
MRCLRQLVWIAIVTLVLVGLSATAIATSHKLVLTGSSTIAPLAVELGRRFESLHPSVRVDVQTGGSSRGISDTRKGITDIGMVSRAMKSDEQDLQAFTIALDGVGIIVHASNPITNLTRQQIIDIYTGKITNWQEVGGKDARITVVNKAEGRSTLELFLSHFELKNSAIKPHIVIGDNQQGIKTVTGNPHAIGYVSIGAAEYDAQHNMPIKLLPLDGIVASVASVRNGTYPLSRELNLVTRKTPKELTKQFIKFARTEQVHDLVEAQYFVPISID